MSFDETFLKKGPGLIQDEKVQKGTQRREEACFARSPDRSGIAGKMVESGMKCQAEKKVRIRTS